MGCGLVKLLSFDNFTERKYKFFLLFVICEREQFWVYFKIGFVSEIFFLKYLAYERRPKVELHKYILDFFLFFFFFVFGVWLIGCNSFFFFFSSFLLFACVGVYLEALLIANNLQIFRISPIFRITKVSGTSCMSLKIMKSLHN